MKILLTGGAGFIGAAVCHRLVEMGHNVLVLDNLNDYYSPDLKCERLKDLGLSLQSAEWNVPINSSKHRNLSFIKANLEDAEIIDKIFADSDFDIVINLAAQGGVRYSVTNPIAYIKSNIDGFLNILEGCRNHKIKHLVYASSSSVYGLNDEIPFCENHPTEQPASLYAATKKSNELMAHAYSHLYGIPTTGLRFFTVYGPWGRPDMSPYLFIDAILSGKPIKVFNSGEMWRDFTYIDDVAESVIRILNVIPGKHESEKASTAKESTSSIPYKIYNVGNQTPVKLMDYIECIEKVTGKKAKKEFMTLQPGDVVRTFADCSALEKVIGFKPSTGLEKGIAETVSWQKHFKNISVK